MAKQTLEQIVTKIDKGTDNLDALDAIKVAMNGVDGRTLDSETRGLFKEAKANIAQALSSQRRELKVLRADYKEALKA